MTAAGGSAPPSPLGRRGGDPDSQPSSPAAAAALHAAQQLERVVSHLHGHQSHLQPGRIRDLKPDWVPSRQLDASGNFSVSSADDLASTSEAEPAGAKSGGRSHLTAAGLASLSMSGDGRLSPSTSSSYGIATIREANSNVAAEEVDDVPIGASVFEMDGQLIIDANGRLLADARDPVTADQIASLKADLAHPDDRVAFKASAKLFMLLLEDRSRAALIAGADAGTFAIKHGLRLLRKHIRPPPSMGNDAADTAANAAWKLAYSMPIMLLKHGGPRVTQAFAASNLLDDAGFSLDVVMEEVFTVERRAVGPLVGLQIMFTYYRQWARDLVLAVPMRLFVARLLIASALSPVDDDPHMELDSISAQWWVTNVPNALSPRERARFYNDITAALAEALAATRAQRAAEGRPLPDGGAAPEASVSDSIGAQLSSRSGSSMAEAALAKAADGSLADLATLLATAVGRTDWPAMRRAWACNGLEEFLSADWTDDPWADLPAHIGHPAMQQPAAATRIPPVERALLDERNRAGLLTFIAGVSPWGRRAPTRLLVAAGRAARGSDAQKHLMSEMLRLVEAPSESEVPALVGSQVLASCADTLTVDMAGGAVTELLRMLASRETVDRMGMPIISEAAPTAHKHAYGFHAAEPLAQFARIRSLRHAILSALMEQILHGSREGSLHAALALYRIAAQPALAVYFYPHLPTLLQSLRAPAAAPHWDALGLVLGSLLMLARDSLLALAMQLSNVHVMAVRAASQAPPGLEWATSTALALAASIVDNAAKARTASEKPGRPAAAVSVDAGKAGAKPAPDPGAAVPGPARTPTPGHKLTEARPAATAKVAPSDAAPRAAPPTPGCSCAVM